MADLAQPLPCSITPTVLLSWPHVSPDVPCMPSDHPPLHRTPDSVGSIAFFPQSRTPCVYIPNIPVIRPPPLYPQPVPPCLPKPSSIQGKIKVKINVQGPVNSVGRRLPTHTGLCPFPLISEMSVGVGLRLRYQTVFAPDAVDCGAVISL